MLLSGVESFRADDFTFDSNGDIVLELEISMGEDCTREDVARAMLGAAAMTRPEPHVDMMLERIRRGERRLLRMDPSYGCSFWCIYEAAVVDPPARLWLEETAGTTRAGA